MRRLIFILVSVVLMCAVGMPTSAQTNLINNPGFELPYPGGYHRNVAQGWTSWLNNGDADYYPEQYGSVRSGANSQAIMALHTFEGPPPFDVGLRQTVSGIPVGSRVRFTAWGSLWMFAVPDPGSAEALIGIGIDPNGGTNPNDGDVVWTWVNASQGKALGGGGWSLPYTQLSAEAVTTGADVTVFLRWKQLWGGSEQRQFWDDASLVILEAGSGTVPTGAPAPGAATPVPPPPVSSFAQAQAPQDDGSIVHIVRSGNTLYAIAAAYGVTVDRILELNPDIGSGRFIYEGQRLLIRPAGSTSAPATSASSSTSVPGIGVAATATNTVAPIGAVISPAAQTDIPLASDTPEPTSTTEPTATPEPTETPIPDAPVEVAEVNTDTTLRTAVCVLLFEDLNMNRIQEQGEGPLAGGVITLKQGENEVKTLLTDDSPEPRCIDDLAAGEYILLAEAPPGYGLVTSGRLGVRLQAGETLQMAFAAAQGVQQAAPPPVNVGDDQTLTQEETPERDADDNLRLLQYMGIIVFGLAGLALVGGVGIALILRRQ